MQWHEWNEAAFERARERGSPVLLFLSADWCGWCRELEREVLADERVRAELSEGFVCIRADKDARPDLDQRYRKGGWPTLAWLDAEGEVVHSDNYLEADALLERARSLRAAWPPGSTPGADVDSPAGEDAELVPTRRREPRTLSMGIVDDVLQTLTSSADPVHGGWGKRHKFPHPDALHFMTVRWSQTGDAKVLGVVRRTLRHMRAGEIYDEVEGGFYRYATQPDWSVPHHEKMLESNAQRLLAYVEAYQALGEEPFRETAEGILRWMESTLLDPETGAFRGSQDAAPEYAHLKTREARADYGAPACDPTLFSHWNAVAVIALLKSSVVLGRDELATRALTTLDFLMENLWDESAGVYHYWDGTYNLPGLLTDQANVLRALVEAMHYAGENRYLEPALAIARWTDEHLSAPDGSFFDSTHSARDRGVVHSRNSSLLENSVMAEALLRLSHMARDSSLAERGRRTLEAYVGDYKRYGHFVAGYGRAVDLLFHEPVHVTVVGPRDADRTRALRRAALVPYVASRIVQTVDPERDVELLERCGLPSPGDAPARAYVHQGRESYAETSRPERLAALMTRAERSN